MVGEENLQHRICQQAPRYQGWAGALCRGGKSRTQRSSTIPSRVKTRTPLPTQVCIPTFLRLILCSYHKDQSLGTLCGRLLKSFRFEIVSAQECQDPDICQDSNPCTEIELNNLVPNFNAHPCLMTTICAILNKTKAAIWGVLNAHPCAATPICAILNKSQRTY